MLRCRVEYLSINKTDPLRQGESPVACLTRVVKALTIAGMGTRQGLTLSFDDMAITSFMSCIPPSMQQEIYREFKRWKISLTEMEEFARVMTTTDSLKSGKSRVAAITTTKARPTAKKNPLKKCTKCNKIGHLEKDCRSGTMCSYCHGPRHSSENCWINPASKSYRPGWSPPRNNSTPRVNNITEDAPGGVVAAIGGSTMDGPTPRIPATLQDGTKIPVLPDSGSCVNITDKQCMEEWGLGFQVEGHSWYPIYSVSGNRLDIIGSANLSFTILGVSRQVKVLVAQGTPIRELIVGWKTLIHWGLFTLASLQPTPASYSEALPHANKSFLKIHMKPIEREYTEPDDSSPKYREEMAKQCKKVLQDLTRDYPLSFAEKIEPGQYIDAPPSAYTCVQMQSPSCTPWPAPTPWAGSWSAPSSLQTSRQQMASSAGTRLASGAPSLSLSPSTAGA